MPSPVIVSLEVPYAENEQQFLLLVVQTAVRTFRSMNARSGERTVSQSSHRRSEPSPTSTTLHREVVKDA
jgi:hypothetical protein